MMKAMMDKGESEGKEEMRYNIYRRVIRKYAHEIKKN
jgi:hypothetical protein